MCVCVCVCVGVRRCVCRVGLVGSVSACHTIGRVGSHPGRVIPKTIIKRVKNCLVAWHAIR